MISVKLNVNANLNYAWEKAGKLISRLMPNILLAEMVNSIPLYAVSRDAANIKRIQIA